MKDVGLLLLRLGISLPMMTHGTAKLMKMVDGKFGFADPIGIGEAPSLVLTTAAEFLCPLLIAVGFKTKWFAIPAAFTMVVAFFIQHHGDPFGDRELAFLYLIGFTAIAILGPGKYSIDRN